MGSVWFIYLWLTGARTKNLPKNLTLKIPQRFNWKIRENALFVVLQFSGRDVRASELGCRRATGTVPSVHYIVTNLYAVFNVTI